MLDVNIIDIFYFLFGKQSSVLSLICNYYYGKLTCCQLNLCGNLVCKSRTYFRSFEVNEIIEDDLRTFHLNPNLAMLNKQNKKRKCNKKTRYNFRNETSLKTYPRGDHHTKHLA